MAEKELRIVCVGRPTKSVGVTTSTTVQEALGFADFNNFEGTVYGDDGSEEKVVLNMSDEVNGYNKLFLTNKVKGGN